jgi:Asp-tRNA(Asn)/Glu-tRNA(Gln) amidotransferase A subunit family amidase
VHLSAAPAIDYESLARSAFIEVAHDFAVNSHRAAPGYLPLDGAGVSLCRVLERARAVSPGRLLHGRELIAQAASRLDGWLRTADALLMPTCPGPACSTDEEPSDNVSAFVAPANIAGLPAVCWPQTMPRAAGLSLQLIGRRADDLRLLGLALCIERALLAAAQGSD